MRIGKRETGNEGYSMCEKMKEVISEKDIGVVSDSNQDFSDYLPEKNK